MRCQQDMLICAEMFLLAIAHQWIFSYREYAAQGKSKHSFVAAAKDSSDIRPVARAIKDGFCTCADGSATDTPNAKDDADNPSMV